MSKPQALRSGQGFKQALGRPTSGLRGFQGAGDLRLYFQSLPRMDLEMKRPTELPERMWTVRLLGEGFQSQEAEECTARVLACSEVASATP